MATSLAAAIKGHFGEEPVLIKSSGGVFEVAINGELVFSKKKTGRFPKDSEILVVIQELTKRNKDGTSSS